MGTLVVIDPRATATAVRADVHLQRVPGIDLAPANGVLHSIVSDGQVDQDYVDARTSGFAQVRALSAGRVRACADLAQVAGTTRATTVCGGCAGTVRQLVASRRSRPTQVAVAGLCGREGEFSWP
jgi:anaerobic selenocysteine-containing dehydrogenase